MPLAVGLTGGIASGKSLAAQAFAGLGAPVINADLVAREAVAPGGEGLCKIREHFGAAFITPAGELDRRRMREHVFAHPGERLALERITHPLIKARLAAWRDAQCAPYCILDVPILVESGMDRLVDRILVIDAPVEVQVERLVARDRIDQALASQMLAAQASREQRLARADDVILNVGLPEVVSTAVAQLHAFYLALAYRGEKQAAGLHLP
ncbi:MAG TPA: dephospho-CoA kinase [Verrucomicrobiae bacterium]|nr:dephospho-CoA kinase [Verrucomicrobiae bacterium]